MNKKTLPYIIGTCLFAILANSIMYLDDVPLLRVFFSLLRLCAVGVALFLSVQNRNLGGKNIRWLMLFFILLGSITIIKHGAINMVISYLINSFGITLLIYNAIKESPRMAARVLANVFATFIYLNFATLLIAPDGIFHGSYLLGRNYNQIGMVLVCGMATYIAAYNMHVKSFASTLLLCAVASVSPLITGSMTSAVGCLLTIVFLFFPKKRQKKIILIFLFAFYILFQILVIFLQSDISGAHIITYIIENVMGKDLTFTDRARVWLIALDMIQDSPLIGYGIRDGDWFETYFGVLSAHNIIFQILIYGGTILFGYFIVMIFGSVRHALKETTTLTYTLLLGLCTTFIMMMMENYNLVLILYLLCITYYSNMLSKSVHQRRAAAREHDTTIQPCKLPNTQ